MHQRRRCSTRMRHTLDYQGRLTCMPHVFSGVGMNVRHSVEKTQEKASDGPSTGRATINIAYTEPACRRVSVSAQQLLFRTASV